jgi:hypothetical protein
MLANPGESMGGGRSQVPPYGTRSEAGTRIRIREKTEQPERKYLFDKPARGTFGNLRIYRRVRSRCLYISTFAPVY